MKIHLRHLIIIEVKLGRYVVIEPISSSNIAGNLNTYAYDMIGMIIEDLSLLTLKN